MIAETVMLINLCRVSPQVCSKLRADRAASRHRIDKRRAAVE
jgi:hypothetical protein